MDGPEALLPALRRLDRRLELAQEAAATDGMIGGAGIEGDLPSLLPSADVVEALMEELEPPLDVPVLAHLGRAFDLEGFDLNVLALAAAADFDPRFAGATIDTALWLLCFSTTDRMRGRARLLPGAPLHRHRLLAPTGRELVLDPRILGLLLGEPATDERLAQWCKLVAPTARLSELALDADASSSLRALVVADGPVGVCLHGPAGAGAPVAAQALAAARRVPLLDADLARGPEAAEAAALLAREARLEGAAVLLRGADGLRGHPDAIATLAAAGAATVLACSAPLRAAGIVDLALPIPPLAQRRRQWRRALRRVDGELGRAAIEHLARRFRLGPEAIDAAAGTAAAAAAAAQRPLVLEDAMAAARSRGGDELTRLARRIVPRFGWDDIVLPADSHAQLRELCDRVAERDRVLDGWGFAQRLGPGTGATALFAGPSGTGKTMAAEVLAGELGLELFAIDLAGVVSKYIGETEKNLDRIFSAAHDLDAILFFDEADALFGKRSEVNDSHDRYANVEISYLLQRMETHAGIAILASNLSQHLDDAFVRRLAFTIHFPFPEVTDRLDLWDRAFPAEVPLASDVDREALAREHRLTGGNIRNVALAAAYLAAADGGRITAGHLDHAVRRELQKLGRGPAAAATPEPELAGLEL